MGNKFNLSRLVASPDAASAEMVAKAIPVADIKTEAIIAHSTESKRSQVVESGS